MFDGGASQENNHLEEQPSEARSLLNKLLEIYDGITEGQLSISNIETLPDLQKLCGILLAHKNSLMTSKNSKLWLQYMDILKCFLKAERTGYWKLHLKALYVMLPYLAASGHNLYTKSVYLHLLYRILQKFMNYILKYTLIF